MKLSTLKWAQWDKTQSTEMLCLFICVCIALCTIVAHNIAQNRPDNFPCYPPHNHHCSDDVYLREGGIFSWNKVIHKMTSDYFIVLHKQSQKYWIMHIFVRLCTHECLQCNKNWNYVCITSQQKQILNTAVCPYNYLADTTPDLKKTSQLWLAIILTHTIRLQ